MKFHIKRRAWTLIEEFTVRDQDGQEAFKVKGKFFHIGDNLRVIDQASHAEVAHIQQKLISLTHHYKIHEGTEHKATVHEKLLHFSGERFKITLENGAIYHIDGSLREWDFTINDEKGNLLAEVGRRVSLLLDSYGINVAQGVDAPFIIALTIVFEMIHEKRGEGEKEKE